MEYLNEEAIAYFIAVFMAAGSLVGIVWMFIKAVDELDRKFTNRYPKLGEDHD